MNLAEIALRRGRDPALANCSAFLTTQGPVGNAEFQRRVFTLVNDLLRAGARPGDKILLRLANSAEFAAGTTVKVARARASVKIPAGDFGAKLRAIGSLHFGWRNL